MANYSNSANNTLISGTSDNDYIYNNGSDNTIVGGAGSDTIYDSGKNTLIKYSSGDGNDYIYGSADNSTLQIDSGSISDISLKSYYSGLNFVSFKIGNGSLILSSYDKDVITISKTNNIIKVDDGDYYSYSWHDGGYQETLRAFTGTDEADLIISNINNRERRYNKKEYLFPTVDAGAGDDTILNYNSYGGMINAGTGADSIYSYNRNSYDAQPTTIIGGTGNDTISLGGGSYYSNSRKSVELQFGSGDGKDVILGYKHQDTINLTDIPLNTITTSGNDVIVSVNGGSMTLKDAKNEIINIKNYNGSVTSYAWHNNQFVKVIYNQTGGTYHYNYSDDSSYYDLKTVSGGTKGDYIYNYGGHVVVNALGGNDTIYSYGTDDDVTVIGGKGDDIVHGAGVFKYTTGDGNDTLYNTFIIELAAGTSITGYNYYSTVQSGYYDDGTYTFNIGTGSITVKDMNMVSVRNAKSGGSYDYTRYINGNKYNDLIPFDSDHYDYDDESDYEAKFKDTVISGGSGADYAAINYGTGDGITLNTNGGNDWIEGQFNNSKINAGTGDDTVFIYENNSTIDAGAGNDWIESDGINSTLNGGDGNDTIKQFGGRDYYSGSDEEEEFDEEAYLSFDDSAKISINGGAGNDLIEVQAWSQSVTGYWEWIETEEDEYEVWNSGTTDEGKYGSKITIVGGTGNDTIRNKFFDSDYFREEDYGYDEDDYDELEETEPIFATVKGHFESDKYIEVTTSKYLNGTTRNSTTTGALYYDRVIQYSDGDGNDVIEDYHSTDTLQIVGTYTTEESGNDVIIKVGTGSIKLLNAKGKTLNINPPTVGGGGDPTNPSGLTDITLTNKDKSPYTAADTVGAIDASARTKAINITGNQYNNAITGGTKADTLNGGTGNDTLIGNAGNDKLDGGNGADILKGGKGADSLTGGAGTDTFLYTDGDGKDIITDYSAGEDIIKLTGGNLNKVSVKGSDVALVVGSGSIKISGGKGKKITFTDSSGYTSSQTYGEKSIAIANGDGQTINTSLNTVAVTLNVSSRTEDLILIGNTKANVIQLGSGSTTVSSGNGKDTIIANENGQALIADYVVGQDKLKFNVDITNAVESGSDIVFTLGTGKVTVAGGKGKKITVIDKDNKTQYIDVSTNVKLTNSDFVDYKALNSAVSIDASKRTKAISIIGNTQNNSIIGGKGKDTINGGDGADTLFGGKGSDILTGGTGADIFYYTSGDGNDAITDYSASEGDIIQLGKNTAVTGVNYSGNDLILTVGKGKITVKGGTSQSVTVFDANDAEMIYRKRKPLTGYEERYFTELWFTEDNNIITEDVDSILKIDSLSTSKAIGKVFIGYDTDLIDKQSTALITYSQNKKTFE